MKLADLDFEKEYTYADYQHWSVSEPLELINGKIFRNAADHTSPKILRNLHREFERELFVYHTNKGIEAASGEFLVLLAKDISDPGVIRTVVRPHLSVVMDPLQLENDIYTGVPDLIVEIISAGDHSKDFLHKFESYQQAGVKEYWLIISAVEACFQYVLDATGRYNCTRPVTEDFDLTTNLFPGLAVSLQRIFGWRQGSLIH